MSRNADLGQRFAISDPRVAEMIRSRQSFRTHGALSARVVDSLGVWDSGQLSGADLDRFRADCASIEYVVWSYSTPIAWFAEDTGWYKVEQRFSVTTSRHQGRLYLIPA